MAWEQRLDDRTLTVPTSTVARRIEVKELRLQMKVTDELNEGLKEVQTLEGVEGACGLLKGDGHATRFSKTRPAGFVGAAMGRLLVCLHQRTT